MIKIHIKYNIIIIMAKRKKHKWVISIFNYIVMIYSTDFNDNLKWSQSCMQQYTNVRMSIWAISTFFGKTVLCRRMKFLKVNLKKKMLLSINKHENSQEKSIIANFLSFHFGPSKKTRSGGEVAPRALKKFNFLKIEKLNRQLFHIFTFWYIHFL